MTKPSLFAFTPVVKNWLKSVFSFQMFRAMINRSGASDRRP
ncbi:hypothetical protein [Fischerella thermalis]